MRVSVRHNDIDQAMRVLKKKLARDGLLREIRARAHYVKPSDQRRAAKAAGRRRAAKAAAKQAAQQPF